MAAKSHAPVSEPSPTLYFTPDCKAEALTYSNWCNLIAVETLPLASNRQKLASRNDSEPEYSALCLSDAGLGLLSSHYDTPFYVAHKRQAYRSELLKACGHGKTLYDACAGFGGDGLVLAQKGWEVTLVERERIVWLMLREAFAGFTNVSTKLFDGIENLRRTEHHWDVVYLDPMFPARSKRALPGRGLQHLRSLAAPFEYDLEACIQLARSRARDRVVLKRRVTDPIVLPPNFQVLGKTIRFDVYVGLVSDSTA